MQIVFIRYCDRYFEKQLVWFPYFFEKLLEKFNFKDLQWLEDGSKKIIYDKTENKNFILKIKIKILNSPRIVILFYSSEKDSQITQCRSFGTEIVNFSWLWTFSWDWFTPDIKVDSWWWKLFFQLNNLILELKIFMILFQIIIFMLKRSICKLWQVKLKFFLWLIYWKRTLAYSPKAVNDLQVHSGKLLQLDLQISNLKVYTDHDNKHHFEVVISTLRPNRTMPWITNLILLNHWWKMRFRSNCLSSLLKLIFQKPISSRQVDSGKQDQNFKTLNRRR